MVEAHAAVHGSRMTESDQSDHQEHPNTGGSPRPSAATLIGSCEFLDSVSIPCQQLNRGSAVLNSEKENSVHLTKHHYRVPSMVLTLALVVAACGGSGSGGATASTTSEPATTAPPTATAPPTTEVPSTTIMTNEVSQTVDIGTVTISDTDCVLNSTTTQISSGQLTFTAVNDTTVRAATEVFRVLEDHSYEDLVAHVEEEVRRADAGEPGLGHPRPPIATFASRGSGLLDGGESGVVTIDADEPGTYGVFCMRYHENSADPVRPFAIVGPLEVGDAAATPSAFIAFIALPTSEPPPVLSSGRRKETAP